MAWSDGQKLIAFRCRDTRLLSKAGILPRWPVYGERLIVRRLRDASSVQICAQSGSLSPSASGYQHTDRSRSSPKIEQGIIGFTVKSDKLLLHKRVMLASNRQARIGKYLLWQTYEPYHQSYVVSLLDSAARYRLALSSMLILLVCCPNTGFVTVYTSGQENHSLRWSKVHELELEKLIPASPLSALTLSVHPILFMINRYAGQKAMSNAARPSKYQVRTRCYDHAEEMRSPKRWPAHIAHPRFQRNRRRRRTSYPPTP